MQALFSLALSKKCVSDAADAGLAEQQPQGQSYPRGQTANLVSASKRTNRYDLSVCADDRAGLLAPAGALLSALWQAQPPLISDFVSQRNLPALLKWAAQVAASSAQHCLVALTLVHQVWSFTASLVSEPLLVQAIPGIVQCCGLIQSADNTQPTADELQLQADIQVSCHISSSLHSVLQGAIAATYCLSLQTVVCSSCRCKQL